MKELLVYPGNAGSLSLGNLKKYIDFRESERGKKTSVCCFTYLCIHWLILVTCPDQDWPATLVNWDDALTNWATQPGQPSFLIKGLKWNGNREKQSINNITKATNLEENFEE